MSHPAPQAAPPLCVVHGPFGAGKSTLLVAAVHLFLAQRHTQGPLRGCRVAVAAHTNAAVDRVMCGLLETGVTGDMHACVPGFLSLLQADGCVSCFLRSHVCMTACSHSRGCKMGMPLVCMLFSILRRDQHRHVSADLI